MRSKQNRTRLAPIYSSNVKESPCRFGPRMKTSSDSTMVFSLIWESLKWLPCESWGMPICPSQFSHKLMTWIKRFYPWGGIWSSCVFNHKWERNWLWCSYITTNATDQVLLIPAPPPPFPWVCHILIAHLYFDWCVWIESIKEQTP